MSKKTAHPDDVAVLRHPAVVKLRRSLKDAETSWGDISPYAQAYYQRAADIAGFDRHGEAVRPPPKLDPRARVLVELAAVKASRELAAAITNASKMLDGDERKRLGRLVVALEGIGAYLEGRGVPWPCTCGLHPHRQCDTPGACGLPPRDSAVAARKADRDVPAVDRSTKNAK